MMRRRFVYRPVKTPEEKAAEVARDKERLHAEKTIGAIKVGKDRYFWMSYRMGVWLESLPENGYREDAPTINGIDGEGFAPTMEEALAAAQRVADTVPGPMKEKHHHKTAKGNHWIARRYKVAHARKPAPSAETNARPLGMLGSLWLHSYDGEGKWSWTEYPITKRTAKRVFICRPRPAEPDPALNGMVIMTYDWMETRQRSFDRGTLKEDGRVSHKDGYFYSGRGKAEYGSGRVRDGAAYPLLGLPQAVTRDEVLATFRQLAKTAHPDAGGDAASFRALVAEKDRALAACRVSA